RALYEMAGVDLTVLEGVDASTALVLLSEVGPDVGRFPTVKQLLTEGGHLDAPLQEPVANAAAPGSAGLRDRASAGVLLCLDWLLSVPQINSPQLLARHSQDTVESAQFHPLHLRRLVGQVLQDPDVLSHGLRHAPAQVPGHQRHPAAGQARPA